MGNLRDRFGRFIEFLDGDAGLVIAGLDATQHLGLDVFRQLHDSDTGHDGIAQGEPKTDLVVARTQLECRNGEMLVVSPSPFEFFR